MAEVSISVLFKLTLKDAVNYSFVFGNEREVIASEDGTQSSPLKCL